MNSTSSTAPERRIPGDRFLGAHEAPGAGPLLLVVGGIHGNEYSGVLAARRVLDKLALEGLPFRGRLVALVGNLAALALDQRFIDLDLNRQWLPQRVAEVTAATETAAVEEREQRELLAALLKELETAQGPVFFIDLHTSSADGPPFVTVGDTLRNRAFALKLGLPVVLGLEEQIDGALLEYVNNLGHVTAGIEGGRHHAPGSVDHHEAALWLALVAAGHMDELDIPDAAALRDTLQAATPGIPPIMAVDLRHPVSADDGFVMAPGYRNFDPVPAGKAVARDNKGPVICRRRSRMLLPLYQAQGNDGFFLVREIRPLWLRLSALLRRSGLPGLVRWLPGVHCHPDRPETLVVNTRVASLLPLQVLHLLGFRKLRWQGHLLLVSRRRFDTRR